MRGGLRLAELYDLDRDPGERFDVAKDHPDVVSRLRARLEAFDSVDPLIGNHGTGSCLILIPWISQNTHVNVVKTAIGSGTQKAAIARAVYSTMAK